MALFPRFGRDGDTKVRPLHPQVQEKMTAMDQDRLLEGFGFRELGRFTERTSRATPGQHFLAGAPVEESPYSKIGDVLPIPTGEDDD